MNWNYWLPWRSTEQDGKELKAELQVNIADPHGLIEGDGEGRVIEGDGEGRVIVSREEYDQQPDGEVE